jgi:hypothetical protein
MRKEDIKIFIDGIENPAEPNQALKDAAERLKGKELFKESNDRARQILSEIKSLPIQERYEKYSERFDNKDNELVEGVFNPENWGRRLVKEEPKLTNVCIKCGVDLYYADNFSCQEHPKNCKGIHLSEETLKERALKEEPKQETLEEAAKRLYPLRNTFLERFKDLEQKIFIEGAERQQEIMYSEEDMIAFGEFIFKHTLLAHSKGVKNLLEQFKKK